MPICASEKWPEVALVKGCRQSASRETAPGPYLSVLLFGQLTMSMLIDHFGWLGNSAMPLSEQRLGTILCLGIALCFIYSSSKNTAPKPNSNLAQE
jgi:hypothetical protein